MLVEQQTGNVAPTQGAGGEKRDDQTIAIANRAQYWPHEVMPGILCLDHHADAKLEQVVAVDHAAPLLGDSCVRVVHMTNESAEKRSICRRCHRIDAAIQGNEAILHCGGSEMGTEVAEIGFETARRNAIAGRRGWIQISAAFEPGKPIAVSLHNKSAGRRPPCRGETIRLHQADNSQRTIPRLSIQEWPFTDRCGFLRCGHGYSAAPAMDEVGGSFSIPRIVRS